MGAVKTEDMVIHAKDIAKVVGAASTNLVTSAAASAVQGPEMSASTATVSACSEKLHIVLVLLQIVVALVTGAYISLKTYRLWKNKNAST